MTLDDDEVVRAQVRAADVMERASMLALSTNQLRRHVTKISHADPNLTEMVRATILTAAELADRLSRITEELTQAYDTLTMEEN